MTSSYQAYVESGSEGNAMAHVLSLPGCFSQGTDRHKAIEGLPEAIRCYEAWLQRHGRSAGPALDAVEVVDVGPFAPGDAAALFSPEEEPISANEMEYRFFLMTYSRADLRELVADLPESILDFEGDSGSFTIRGVLRHVGNVEEWYVFRLVDPDTLPSEWDEDDALPIFPFLEMERRTVVERLRRLTATERSTIFRPDRWSEHPEEPWTARKALRRLLEHEREHIRHVKEIIDARESRRGSGDSL